MSALPVAMESLAGGEQSATQPVSLVQLPNSPPIGVPPSTPPLPPFPPMPPASFGALRGASEQPVVASAKTAHIASDRCVCMHSALPKKMDSTDAGQPA